MKTTLRLAAVLAVFHWTAGLKAADEFTFKIQEPKEGTVRADTDEMAMDLKIQAKVGDKVINEEKMAQNESKKSKMTVLAASGINVTKAKVVYEAYKNDDPAAAEAPAPELNKTYLLERKDNQVLITDEKGGELPEKEKAYLLKDHKRFGKPNGFEKWLNGKTLKAGQALEMTKEEAGEIFEMNAEAGMKIDSFTMTFKGVEKAGEVEKASFDAKLVVVKGDDSMKMTMEMAGPISVDAKTGWPLTMALSGPIKIAGQTVKDTMTIDMSGTGTFKGNKTSSYQVP
ncbi:MAG: hypothetical protein HY291_02900 [Planctomycetes bacterium]|nr:hypothetical protein [Planctomycetota bacterium]